VLLSCSDSFDGHYVPSRPVCRLTILRDGAVQEEFECDIRSSLARPSGGHRCSFRLLFLVSLHSETAHT